MLFASGILRFRTSADILVIGPRAAFGLGHHLSGLVSEDDVRRRLTQSLVDPASRDAIRRFWGHWQSDSIRITIVSDQDLIDRIAMMTVRGPLAAHVTLDTSARHMPSVSGKKSSEPLAARRQGAVTRRSSSSPPANAVVARPPAVSNRPVTGPSAVRPSGLVAPATPGTGSAGAAQQTEVKKPVPDMTVPERLTEVLNLTAQYLGPDLREQFIAALEGAAFFVILDVLGLWAALHAVGAGFVLDAFIAIGLFLAGRAAIEAGASLIRCLEIVYSAKSEDDLNEAAKLVANVVALIGVAIFIAIVTHGLNRAEAPSNKSEGLRRAPEEPRKPQQRLQERPSIVGKSEEPPGGGLVIGRLDDLQAKGALRPGERTLLPKMKDNLGSPKANWKRNSSLLREEMARGKPIRDASNMKPDDFPVPTPDFPGRTVRQTFTGMERNVLRNRGWTFDGEYWNPPKQ